MCSRGSGSAATWRSAEGDDRISRRRRGEEDYGLLIGKRGQTIDALQLLCYQAAFRGHAGAQAGRGRRRRLPRAPPRGLDARADRAAEQALDGNRPSRWTG